MRFLARDTTVAGNPLYANDVDDTHLETNYHALRVRIVLKRFISTEESHRFSSMEPIWTRKYLLK